MPYPCSGARVSVFRISMSRVPGSRSGFLAIAVTIDRLWVDCQWFVVFQVRGGRCRAIGVLEIAVASCSIGLPGTTSATNFIVHFIRPAYPTPQLCIFSRPGVQQLSPPNQVQATAGI